MQENFEALPFENKNVDAPVTTFHQDTTSLNQIQALSTQATESFAPSLPPLMIVYNTDTSPLAGSSDVPSAPGDNTTGGGGDRATRPLKEVSDDVYERLAEEMRNTRQIPQALQDAIKNGVREPVINIDRLNEMLKEDGLHLDLEASRQGLTLRLSDHGEEIQRVFSDSRAAVKQARAMMQQQGPEPVAPPRTGGTSNPADTGTVRRQPVDAPVGEPPAGFTGPRNPGNIPIGEPPAGSGGPRRPPTDSSASTPSDLTGTRRGSDLLDRLRANANASPIDMLDTLLNGRPGKATPIEHLHNLLNRGRNQSPADRLAALTGNEPTETGPIEIKDKVRPPVEHRANETDNSEIRTFVEDLIRGSSDAIQNAINRFASNPDTMRTFVNDLNRRLNDLGVNDLLHASFSANADRDGNTSVLTLTGSTGKATSAELRISHYQSANGGAGFFSVTASSHDVTRPNGPQQAISPLTALQDIATELRIRRARNK